ncbi:MAG: glycosyltransferase family A protein [Bacteroidales bacterium]|nr:glycosyltransferase family A protein [Bacteroidales bacterium]
MISILTATYNRASLLPELFKSLVLQIDQDFEWIVVDDGSTDNTVDVLKGFVDQDVIPINWISVPNGGKHRAINKAVNMAKGEFCFIVDSDDRLDYNAVNLINYNWNQVKNKKHYAGVVGLKALFSGEVTGTPLKYLPKRAINTDLLSYRMKYKIEGDRAEVFKTDVLKEFPFPEYENEKFCPEALVWNRIAQKYKMRYFNDIIYFCDYLPDGLTAKIVRLRCENPTASTVHYSELYHYNIPLTQKIKAAINFWRFSFWSRNKYSELLKQIGFFQIIWMPIGYLMYKRDKKRI